MSTSTTPYGGGGAGSVRWSNGSGTIPAATLTRCCDRADGLDCDRQHRDRQRDGRIGTFSLPDKDVDFLAAGETLTLTYDVTVADNSGAGNATSAAADGDDHADRDQ